MLDPPPWPFDLWVYAAFGVLFVVMCLLQYLNPRPW
jgi:hypothetical protein